MDNILVDKLLKRIELIETHLSIFNQIWLDLRQVSSIKNLTPDAIRKQLVNGNFEEGFDFKYENNKILMNQGAVERIRRQRKRSNG